MEALVAQDRGDVLEPGHRVPHVGAGEPVLGAGRLDRVDGVVALEPDRIEIGELGLELGDQLCHWDPHAGPVVGRWSRRPAGRG